MDSFLSQGFLFPLIMKSSKSLPAFLALVLILSSLLVAYSPLGKAQNGTDVSGIISQDTTWTQANSPYTLTGNLLVNNGVTLTIQPGVTVNINSYYIEVNGTLVAIGTSNNMIRFNDGAITFTLSSTPWNNETDSGSTIQYSVFNGTSTQEFIIALYTELFSNNDVSYPVYVDAGSPIISNNVFNARTFYGTGGGAISSPAIQLTSDEATEEATVSDNIISGGFGTASVDIEGGYPVIEGNLITGAGVGIGIEGAIAQTGATIINNTIIGCSYDGIYADSNTFGPITVSFNNLEDNSNYNLYWQRTDNLNASYNYWGTSDVQAINQTIYDFKNDFSLGTVTYVPFLTALNSQAPVLPTPTPTASPTSSSSTAATPTPTTSPSQSPSTATPSPTSMTNTQTSTPAQSPSVPEFPALSVFATLMITISAAMATMVTVKKRK